MNLIKNESSGLWNNKVPLNMKKIVFYNKSFWWKWNKNLFEPFKHTFKLKWWVNLTVQELVYNNKTRNNKKDVCWCCIKIIYACIYIRMCLALITNLPVNTFEFWSKKFIIIIKWKQISCMKCGLSCALAVHTNSDVESSSIL